MPQRCPAQDGYVTEDPYGDGIVACINCGCQYHAPCARLFEAKGCQRCDASTLRTIRVSGNAPAPTDSTPRHRHVAIASPRPINNIPPASDMRRSPVNHERTTPTSSLQRGVIWAALVVLALISILIVISKSKSGGGGPTSPTTGTPQPAPAVLVQPTPSPRSPDESREGELLLARRREQAVEYVTKARELYERRNYEDALSLCGRALELDPNSTEPARLKEEIERTLQILNQ